MELIPIYKRVIGLDVHQAQITACAIIEAPDGQIQIAQRQFGAFKRDRQALAEWVVGFSPECVVMESTGIYWKSPYTALEAAGIRAQVVNARPLSGSVINPENLQRVADNPIRGDIAGS